MCNITISEQMKNFLSTHAADIENEKAALLKEYYSDHAELSMEVGTFFKEYVDGIHNNLRHAKIVKNDDGHCPFVIIGSIVEVQDTADMEIYKYHVVLPYTKQTGSDIDCASCLSPLGKALLLKSVDDTVSTQIPAGVLHYVIKSITLPLHNVDDRSLYIPQNRMNITM